MDNLSRALSLHATIFDLERFRDFVADTAEQMGASRKESYDLILAVDEAIANILEHGYRGGSGPVEVMLERVGDEIIVHIRDIARVFDPTRLAPPDLNLPLEERQLGGLGVYLIQKKMDQVSYRQRPEGGNELILVKKIAPNGGSK